MNATCPNPIKMTSWAMTTRKEASTCPAMICQRATGVVSRRCRARLLRSLTRMAPAKIRP